jgi:hypothetical protein
VQAGKGFTLGPTGSVQLGVSANTTARIAPIWKDQYAGVADLVERFELKESLTADNLLLACQFGGGANVSAAGSFKYSLLSGSATLQAGADASIVYVRAFPRNTPLHPMLEETFREMKLPAAVEAPPLPGEVVVFEYGGYLRFGASVSAGYEIKGTKSFEIRDLKLSERYALAVVGSLGASASLAGRYSIEVRAASDPDWARVVVRRSRSEELSISADLKVNASLVSQGLPRSGKEFLGALIGTNAKNWLNLIDSAAGRVGKITDIEALKDELDTLSASFIERYAGKALDLLDSTELPNLLKRLNEAVASYRNLEKTAVAVVDRFLDPLTDSADELMSHLDTLLKLTSWNQLKGKMNPFLWNVVQQLTGGDPLGWILGQTTGPDATLAAMKKRAKDAKELISGTAHEEIRKLVRLAKSEFGLDHFFNVLDSVDTKEDLKKTLTKPVKGFVERLIGRAVDSLEGRELKSAFELIKEIAGKRKQFWDTFDKALETAASQKFSLAISEAYKSASERTALIDIEVRLRREGEPFPAGLQMLREAAHGDFVNLLSEFQPEVVRIRKAAFTSRLSEESTVGINIAGWHRNFNYSAVWRVITASSQQIRTTPAGGINVFTQVDMTVSSEGRRKTTKSEEKMTTNFLLRYLGETRNVIAGSTFDEDDLQYAIEVITSQTAQYESTFTDSNTSEEELRDYFRFAKALGLDAAGATADAVAPMIRKQGDGYGAVSGEYKVQFSEAGLKHLFASATTDSQIRTLLRRIVLANYIGRGNIAEVAALYASNKVRELYENHGPNFIHAGSILADALRAREVVPEDVIPGVKVPSVSNQVASRVLVAGLLEIEADLIEAFRELRTILTSGVPIPLDQFESRLQRFGNALTRFDKRDLGDNSIFAVIDGLIALSTSAAARSSALSFGFTGTDGKPKQLLFASQAAKAAAA